MGSYDFVNHSYDFRPNWTPLGPVTIINMSKILFTWMSPDHLGLFYFRLAPGVKRSIYMDVTRSFRFVLF